MIPLRVKQFNLWIINNLKMWNRFGIIMMKRMKEAILMHPLRNNFKVLEIKARNIRL